jgi:transglutaminase-like putative cysteine protease
MNRRTFIYSGAVASATLALPRPGRLFASTSEAGWRTFEVTTRVEILNPTGATYMWLPAALLKNTRYQTTLSNTFQAEGGAAELVVNKDDDYGIVTAKFPEGVRPVLTLTSKVSTRDVAVDVTKPGRPPKADSAELQKFLQPTKMVPTDGVVKDQSASICLGISGDINKARAIYEWIVDNSFRNPKTRGCGIGDIRFMLESKDLGGKCADLNALYVGLARAAGLPARHVYGLRIAKSDLGFKSLGPSTEVCTKGQHCRAEVYCDGYGWVPADPADVRKVVLEEPPGNLPMDSEPVQKARKYLFGAWNMNWMAFNCGHDVALPGSKLAPVNYFMYPQAETAEGRVDPFDADKFKYEITSKELTSPTS